MSEEEKTKHVARAYQEEIFDRARRENVIATLDTGTGKTLIAAMLIKWALALPTSIDKKVIFLVPTVSLVYQQRTFLESQIPVRVNTYVGSMSLDGWEKSRWETEFDKSDCLVMTAQIFLNILTHGYWSLERVALIVFDECHHAKDGHPYNSIMAHHYPPCSEKPRIFGMTASPTCSIKNPLNELFKLQKNLFSRVMAVKDNVEEHKQYRNRPDEVVVVYECPRSEYPTYTGPLLWDLLGKEGLLSVLESDEKKLKKLERRYTYTFGELGPLASDYFVYTSLISLTREAFDTVVEKYPYPVIQEAIEGSPTNEEKSVPKSVELDPEILARVTSIIKDCEKHFEDKDMLIPSGWLTQKVATLVGLLKEYRCDNFRGIVFVDQKQVAKVLAWMLPRIDGLSDWIRSSELTGHGSEGYDSINGMSTNAQQNVVQSFRNGEVNLVIGTAVAEEGLDFSACALVIRFDVVRNMIGYVQSRGRARQAQSSFVVMFREDEEVSIQRYRALKESEGHLRNLYQSLNDGEKEDDVEFMADEGEEENLDASDRETYVIPTTGATLTHGSAIALLEHLCSIIPKDAYTPTLQPRYTGKVSNDGYFIAEVRLPNAIPLRRRIYVGNKRPSKKGAKRSVAFIAVKELHKLGVFDDHLSPVRPKKGEHVVDADGQAIAKIDEVPPMMDVFVVSPWKSGPPWILQRLTLNGSAAPSVGLVTGGHLPEIEMQIRGTHVRVHPPEQVTELSEHQLNLMDKFTRMCLWWFVSGSPLSESSAPCAYLIPLSNTSSIDWTAIEKAVANKNGSYDLNVTEEDEGSIVLMNNRKFGHTLILKKIRTELTIDSEPPKELKSGLPSLYDYFEGTYRVKIKNPEKFDTIFSYPAGRIFEVDKFPRLPYSCYVEDGEHTCPPMKSSHVLSSSHLLPESFCLMTPLSATVMHAYHLFYPLCQRICDVFRARAIIRSLNLPHISEDLLIEALTLPCANAGFDNQRLETMGDSVLKLSVIVYIYNRFPLKHEGQLEALKSTSISNRLLLARARQKGLERFISGENRHHRTWKFIISPESEKKECEDGECERYVRRKFVRRSLQECMESLLGASYITGGINSALQTGTALGLCFGGSEPWTKRYPPQKDIQPSSIFTALQEKLRHPFQDGSLLYEAVKHPTFDDWDVPCYQRLEFLGDAVVELVVTTYLYNKFPKANSGQLSWMRARVICNATLAALSVKKLELHKYLFANSVALTKCLSEEAEELKSVTYEDIALNDWKYDPPKVLADLFESIVGAIFVDSGFNFEYMRPIVERLMHEALIVLRPEIPLDPVSSLLQWVAKSGCTKVKFTKVHMNPLSTRKDGMVLKVHDQIVSGPFTSRNLPLAKGTAAKHAMETLSDGTNPLALSRICECRKTKPVDTEDESKVQDLPVRGVRERDLDVETEEGFAVVGRIRLEEVGHVDEGSHADNVEEDEVTE